jgi:diguanylate cyclase (GGDEF)-like protein
MMYMDLPTLYYQLLTFQALFVVIHIMIWRAHNDLKSLKFWAIANAMGAGIAILGLYASPQNGAPESFVAAVVGNTLFIVVNLTQWLGVRTLLGKSVPWRLAAVIAILPAFCLVALYMQSAPIWVRAAMVSMVVAIIAGMQLHDLIGTKPILGTSLIRMATIIHLAFYALRVVLIFRIMPMVGGELEQTSLTGWTLHESFVCLVLVNVAYLMVISEQQRMTLDVLAHTDSLTGLLNRRAFAEKSEIAALGGGAMLLLDIDQFKAVNDQFGHAQGDAVLQRFADVLRKQVRAHDIVARTGGEEFSIVLPGQSVAEGTIIAERIRAVCAATDFGNGLKITVSVGLCALNPRELVAAASARADTALYLAKSNGRNRIEMAAA